MRLLRNWGAVRRGKRLLALSLLVVGVALWSNARPAPRLEAAPVLSTHLAAAQAPTAASLPAVAAQRLAQAQLRAHSIDTQPPAPRGNTAESAPAPRPMLRPLREEVPPAPQGALLVEPEDSSSDSSSSVAGEAELSWDVFAAADQPPLLQIPPHPVLEHLGALELSDAASNISSNASYTPPQVAVRRITIALRDEEDAPSEELYEAARAVFDSQGALLADDFEGRPLRNRCWIAEQPGELTGGKANCAVAVHGNKCLHCWPSFYLIGAPKAGSTVLWHSLAAHPQVVPRRGKEWHYWSWLWPSNAGSESLARTERYTDAAGGDYMAHVARNRELSILRRAFRNSSLTHGQHAKLPFLLGDGDPNYLYSTMRFPWVTPPVAHGQQQAPTFSTAQVMRAAVPDAKLVLILREPAARALSHMRMTCEAACRRENSSSGAVRNAGHVRDMGRCIRCPVSPEQWAQVVSREVADLQALCTGPEARRAGSGAADELLAAECAAPRALHDAGGHRLALRAMCSGTWVGRSIYYHWLEEWLSVWPRQQLHLVRYEDWARQPGVVTAQVLEFLGAAPFPQMEGHLPQPRKATAGDDASATTPETRRLLRSFYAPFNAKLAHILNDTRWTWEDY